MWKKNVSINITEGILQERGYKKDITKDKIFVREGPTRSKEGYPTRTRFKATHSKIYIFFVTIFAILWCSIDNRE